MKVAIAVVVVLLALAGLMAAPTKAITCGQINSGLASCTQYLTTGGTPPTACCTGVRNLKSQVQTTPDRQTACNCVKQATGADKTIRDDAAASLASKCGVQLSFDVSRNVDCSKIS